MKDKFLTIFLNPFIISLIVIIPISLLLPNEFTKYRIEFIEQEIIEGQQRVYYRDLNNDQISEKIICKENREGKASYKVYGSNGELINQWNFTTHFPSSNKLISFFDANNNGLAEIYLVTQNLNTAYLNIHEPFDSLGINKENIYIDTIAEHNGSYNFWTTEFNMADINGDDESEILFSISTGFSGYPRHVYSYNKNTNIIAKSQHLTNCSAIREIVDVTGDGSPEIIIKNNSACNHIDSIYTTRSDCSLWLTVLNNNLEFLFEPKELKTPFSAIEVIILKSKDSNTLLYLLKSKKNQYSPSKLFTLSSDGSLLSEKILKKGEYQIYNSQKQDHFILFNKINGLITFYDKNINEIHTVETKSNSDLYKMDLNGDKHSEWIFISDNKKFFTVYSSDFKNKVVYRIPVSGVKRMRFGKVKNILHDNFFIQKGNYCFILRYSQNKFYFFKYVIYILLYLVTLSVSFLIIHGYKIRNNKRLVIEKQIWELQIKTIKNQVDPHFVFNAINSMSEMMLTDNKIEADRFLCKFSDLMRKTLQQSDKISHSLKNELDYIENYIQLQIIRYNYQFSYQIEINKNINQDMIVPKHVLYTYVENAIKHGLSEKKGDGLLKICVDLKSNNLFLIIEDNGTGIDKSGFTQSNTTGNGLQIMKNIFDLYMKITKKKISYELIELFDDKKQNSGIRVEILLSS